MHICPPICGPSAAEPAYAAMAIASAIVVGLAVLLWRRLR